MSSTFWTWSSTEQLLYQIWRSRHSLSHRSQVNTWSRVLIYTEECLTRWLFVLQSVETVTSWCKVSFEYLVLYSLSTQIFKRNRKLPFLFQEELWWSWVEMLVINGSMEFQIMHCFLIPEYHLPLEFQRIQSDLTFILSIECGIYSEMAFSRMPFHYKYHILWTI